MDQSKKVMQINCFFRFGSTGRIVGTLHDGLVARGLSSIVCYARRPVSDEIGVYRVSDRWEQKSRAVLSRLLGGDFGRGGRGTRQIRSCLYEECPDIVHLHVLNGHFVNVYRLLHMLGDYGIRTVLTLHAEEMYTAGCDHAHACDLWQSRCRDCPRVAGRLSRLWRDDAAVAFEHMREALEHIGSLTVVGVSPWVTARAAKSPLLFGRELVTVPNGVDTETFCPRHALAAHLRRQCGIAPEEPVILFVTPRLDHPDKGGRYVFEVFERILRRLPTAHLVIVGWDGDTGSLPPTRVPAHAVLARTIAVAHTSDTHALAGFYTMASVTLLLSRRETFSMVCAESLACGTPVVGFLSGGPESIALPAYSRFVPQGDVDALADAVMDVLSAPPDRAKVAAEAAVYDSARMVEGYLRVYGLLSKQFLRTGTGA